MKIPFILCVGLIFTASLNAQTLLHYYDFNGGVTDLVGSADGTLIDGASVADGKLILDGSNDNVSFAAKLVPVSGPFTVAFFMSGPTSLSGFHEIISQGSSGGPGFYIGYSDSTFRLGDDWISPGVAFPTDGLQHHLALVADTASASFYIDGSLLASRNSPLVIGGTDNTRLGKQFSSSGEYFAGTVDELRIYAGALTGTQVAALAAIPEPSAAAALGGLAALAVSFVARRRRRAAA